MKRLVLPSVSQLMIFVCLSVACTIAPVSAFASKVVILQSSNIASYNRTVNAFLDSLPTSLKQQAHRFSLEGDLQNGNAIIEEIRSLDVKLVIAVGLKAALVVRQHLSSVPSIFCMVIDPGKYQLTKSHMAGIALEVPFSNQMATLREVLPRVKRVGVLYNPLKTGRIMEAAKSQAKVIGIELVPRVVSSEKDVPATLRVLVPDIDALWLLPDSTVLTADSFHFLLQTTLEANIPVVGFSSDLVRKGALLSVHFHYEDVGRQVARLTKKFFKGHKFIPGVIWPPEPLRWAINLNTANFLDIAVPPDVLTQFHEMY